MQKCSECNITVIKNPKYPICYTCKFPSKCNMCGNPCSEDYPTCYPCNQKKNGKITTKRGCSKCGKACGTYAMCYQCRFPNKVDVFNGSCSECGANCKAPYTRCYKCYMDE